MVSSAYQAPAVWLLVSCKVLGTAYATQNRRVVMVLVNAWAMSGRAALRALPSSLEDVTAF